MKEGGRLRVLFRLAQLYHMNVLHEYFFILWMRQLLEVLPLLSVLFQAVFTICYF